MDQESLGTTVATLLAISLATERLVVVIKTILPGWFSIEQKTAAKEVDLTRDRWRRLRVLIVAYLAAWLIAGVLVEPVTSFPANLFGDVPLGGMALMAPIVALLCSSGSAFWSQVIGVTSALKDIKTTEKATASLEFSDKATSRGTPPDDSGVTARGNRERPAAGGRHSPEQRVEIRSSLAGRRPVRIDEPLS